MSSTHPPPRAAEHIALLGDSIFDNAAYVPRGQDVVSHLRLLLAAESKATLYAVDGATTSGLRLQLAGVAKDVTRLVVSIGGNDALSISICSRCGSPRAHRH